jgi:hypothetical protein
MKTEVEREAKRLYDLCSTPKPTWEQLGDVTKSVWRDLAAVNVTSGADTEAGQGEKVKSSTQKQQFDLFT